MKRLLALAILLQSSWMAHASDANGDFAVRGVGGQPCSVVLAAIERNRAVTSEVTAWVQGYASATNRLTANTYDMSPVTDPAAMTGMVLGVCRINQTVPLEAAANSVLASLSVAKVGRNSPLVQLKAGDSVVVLRVDTIDRVHAALTGQKLLPAKKPGAPFDSATERALRAFQKTQNLAQTGLPDAPTVVRLLVELPAASAPSAARQAPAAGRAQQAR